MKLKTFFLLSTLFFCLNIHSQVFSTARVLGPAKFSAGIAPAWFNNERALFFFIEAGIIKGIDFELKYGIIEFTDYYGADLEWKLYSSRPFQFSLTTGFHVYGEAGADVAANMSFRIINQVNLYTGIDSDINFGDELHVPLWLPAGVEIKLNKNVRFLFEGEIPLNPESYAVVDGGIRVYF